MSPRSELLATRELQDMHAEINRLRQMVGTQPSQHPRAAGGAATSVAIQPYIVNSMGVDYVWARPWDGEDEGSTTYKVALPYMLRSTPFNGKTVHGIAYIYLGNTYRRAQIPNEVEYQVIVPGYQTGDMIYVVNMANALLKDPGGSTMVGITRLDLNVDGRAWAEENE